MWTEDDVMAAMQQGDIAYCLCWGGSPLVPMNNPDQSKVVGQVEIGLMPSVDGKHPYTVAGPMGWAISKNTKHPKEAWEFVQFMAGPEGRALRSKRQESLLVGNQSSKTQQFRRNFPNLRRMANSSPVHCE